jgi:hypothetical protein
LAAFSGANAQKTFAHFARYDERCEEMLPYFMDRLKAPALLHIPFSTTS